MFQVLNKVGGGKPRGTPGGRRLIESFDLGGVGGEGAG